VIDADANPMSSPSSSLMQINVTAVNDAPDLLVNDVEVTEDGGLFAFDADGEDVENDDLTFSLKGDAFDNQFFEIDPETGVVSFISQPDFYNPLDGNADNQYRLSVTVTDALGETDSEFVFVKVTEVNQAPFITTTELNQFENVTPSHQIESFDREGQELTFEFVGTDNDNELFVLDAKSGRLTLVETPDFEAGEKDFVVDVRVTDSEGLSDVSQINVSVDNVVEAISLSDITVSTERDSTTGLNVFTPGESQQIFALAGEATFRLVEGPQFGEVVLNADGVANYTPDSAGVVQDTFVIETENGGETSRKTVTVQMQVGPAISQDSNSPSEASSPVVEEISENSSAANDSNASSAEEDLTQGPMQESERGIVNSDGQNAVLNAVGASSNTSGADSFSNDFAGAEVSQESELGVYGFDYSTYVYASSVETELLTEQLVTGLVRSGRAVMESAFEQAFLSANFWQQMDTAEQEYLFDRFETSVASTITAGAIGVTSVVVSFALRAMLIGISLTAVNSAQWWVTSFDISSIIESEDDESIESMVDGA